MVLDLFSSSLRSFLRVSAVGVTTTSTLLDAVVYTPTCSPSMPSSSMRCATTASVSPSACSNALRGTHIPTPLHPSAVEPVEPPRRTLQTPSIGCRNKPDVG
jgi:hypothetical protein